MLKLFSLSNIIVDTSKYSFTDSAMLSEIYTKISGIMSPRHDTCKKSNSTTAYRDELTLLNSLIDSLIDDLPSISQFNNFLEAIHDLLVLADSNVRSILLRVIRFCITGGSEYVTTLYADVDILWIISVSFEKDVEYLIERIQAHKIIRVCLQLLHQDFPLMFARSLVAVANQKDDKLRRESIEDLRILCINNPKVFSTSNGMCYLTLFMSD